jgi:hypothetical protein
MSAQMSATEGQAELLQTILIRRSWIFKGAIAEAKAFLQNLQRATLTSYWDNAKWGLPDATGLKTEFTYQTADILDYDRRGIGGFFFWAPPKKSDPSAPSIYLTTFADREGGLLTGDKAYRLRVPPNAPAKQYWSATVYDFDTAGFIREAPVVSTPIIRRPLRTETGRSTSISPHRLPPERKTTGSQQQRAGHGSCRFVCTDPTSRFSTRLGSCPTSNVSRPNDVLMAPAMTATGPNCQFAAARR